MEKFYRYHSLHPKPDIMKEPYSNDNCEVDVLTHKGTIKNIDTHAYYVSIISQSACSSCHSKGVCSVTEMQEKMIEVPRKPGESFDIGDTVEIIMSKSMGAKAVLIGYIIPFVLLLITLIAAFKVFDSEGISGLISLSVLVLYYMVLYFLRDRFKKTFNFSIRA